MASGPITPWQIDGETMETVTDFIFLGSKITADGDCSHEFERPLLFGRKAMTNLGNILKSRDSTLPTKVCLSSQSYVFSSSHVWMWELDYKESWVLKKWCFWTVVLEKTLENPLGCKEIKSVNPKWNQSWIFVGRTDAEAETPILWPPDVKSWLIWKDPDAGKDWRQEEMTEDEMVGWHHQLDGPEFEQVLGLVMDREAWHVAVHRVANSWTRLSDQTELNWIKRPMTWKQTKLWNSCRFWGVAKLVQRLWTLLSRVRLFATPWTIQSTEFSRREYWSE